MGIFLSYNFEKKKKSISLVHDVLFNALHILNYLIKA